MRGDETSSTLLIEVEGRPAPTEVAAMLTSATIDDSLDVPSMFALRFLDDGATVLDKAGFRIGAKIRLSVQRSGNATPVVLLHGEVTAVEIDISVVGGWTVVRGYDMSHRLFRGRRMGAFVNQKAPDIAASVARRAGLRPGAIDQLGAVLPHVSQGGVNDWTLLRQLAVQVGAVVAVTEDALDFRAATPADRAPSGTRSRDDPLVLEHGVNLVSLRASVTAADQVPEVEVRSWDVQAKRAVVGTAKAATTSAVLDHADPSALADAFGSPGWVEASSSSPNQKACETLATSIADRIGGSFAELDGVARGNPSLRAGVAVRLAKTGAPFDGRYTLTSARHEFTPNRGYLTAFTVSNRSDRALLGLISGGGRGRPERVDGVVSAIVSDVKDPVGAGRVRVTFPVFSDTYVSSWARTVQLGAGSGRGSAVLPEVGDEVLVAFGLGEFGEPFVLGGLYNGKDQPSPGWGDRVDGSDGSVICRSFTSRTGMVVELAESASEQKLSLTTNGGAQRVTLVQKPDGGIEIISEGPLMVTAKRDVTIASQSGDITIGSATGAVKITGTKVSVDAKTGLTLHALGETKVTGSTVSIN